jgi:hypothetical protein
LSFNSQNGFGRTFENRLGDYCVIITSTTTNQGGEFSVIIYVIILIVNMLNIGIILLLIKSPCTPTLYLNNCDTVDFFSVFDSDDSLREETSHDLETPVLSEMFKQFLKHWMLQKPQDLTTSQPVCLKKLLLLFQRLCARFLISP